MKKRIFTTEEISNIISLFEKNLTVTDIYKKTNINSIYIRKILINNGFVPHTKFKYNVDHNIFSDIDTEEKSYWLGFLFADGYIRKRKNKNIYELRLKISKNDEHHLKLFKSFLKSTHVISHNISSVNYNNKISISNVVSLSVYSKQIFNDLCDKGCIPNKSHRIDKPNINYNYYRHFIRGYFDGDGCVSIDKNNKNKYLSFTSCSLKILEWIDFILSENNISHREVSNNKNINRLIYFRKNDLNLIYDFLYKDSNIFLNRKKEKFKNIIK